MDSENEDEHLNSISGYLTNEETLFNDSADAVVKYLNEMPSSSSSESMSSSDESEQEQEQAQEYQKFSDFCDIIDSYNYNEFKSHLGMRRSTVEFLIDRYTTGLAPKTHTGGKISVPPRKRVYMFIWYISNTATFKQLGSLFGVSSSTFWSVVNNVSAWIISIGHEYVNWPQDAAAVDVRKKFEGIVGIPGVMGVIDCTQIRIRAPAVAKDYYVYSKSNYTLVLQAMVDADKRFTDITCGEPGSQDESRVLQKSDLFKRVQKERHILFPNRSFVLGDSAYPSTDWLVPPFKDDGYLTVPQQSFNRLHSSACAVAHDTFTLLKTRFRRLLHFREQSNLCFVVNIIVSCCVLHNICIKFGDVNIKSDADDTLEESEYAFSQDRPYEGNDGKGDSRRELLFEYLQERGLL